MALHQLNLKLEATDVRDALDQLDGRAQALISRTIDWSRINSGSYEPEGLRRMRDVLADAFAILPAEVFLEPLAPSLRIAKDGAAQNIDHVGALRMRARPNAPIQVALTGHFDTVFPAAHPFQTPWEEGGRLRGPGVADMKGGLSVMLAALEAFEATPGDKRVGYEVLLSPDEEIGSPASAPLLAELGARSQFGMVYEPAPDPRRLIGARKGSGNFSFVFRGQSAHVGREFAKGRNAVAAAARAAAALDALNGKQDGVTFNVAAIDGGGALNTVPDLAVLRFNMRAPDPESAAWALAEIEAIADAASRTDGIAFERHGAFARPPKPMSPAQSKIAEWFGAAGAALGLELEFASSGGVCEGNNLAAAGCPNIDTLGPVGGALHTDQEYALPETFAERAKLSYLLLHAVNTGALDPRELAQ